MAPVKPPGFRFDYDSVSDWNKALILKDVNVIPFTSSMPTTRSKTKQTHVEDYTEPKPAIESAATNSKQAPKRKSAGDKAEANPSKRRKLAHEAEEEQDKESDEKDGGKTEGDEAEQESSESTESIVINRAPVLQLYAACIAQFLYPEQDWKTCLSAGAAVSGLCAVAKGRSIGVFSEHEDDSAEKKESGNKQELEQLEVMQFKLHLKNGLAVVGGSAKQGGEEALKRKFGGEEQYEKVKACFVGALRTWKGSESDLNKKAFHFYEEFRPNVGQGQKGWGRKAELKFDTVRKTIEKS